MRNPFTPSDILRLTMQKKHLLQPELHESINKLLELKGQQKRLSHAEQEAELAKYFGWDSVELSHRCLSTAMTLYFENADDESISQLVDKALGMFNNKYGFFILSLSFLYLPIC